MLTEIKNREAMAKRLRNEAEHKHAVAETALQTRRTEVDTATEAVAAAQQRVATAKEAAQVNRAPRSRALCRLHHVHRTCSASRRVRRYAHPRATGRRQTRGRASAPRGVALCPWEFRVCVCARVQKHGVGRHASVTRPGLGMAELQVNPR